MSLYKFVENNIKECPDLLLFSNPNSNTTFSNLLKYYKSKERSFPIQSFMDILMYDTISRCSQNVIEYDLLKSKTRKISGLLQAQFDLELSSALSKKS